MCLGIWLSMGERTILEWNEDKSPYAETRDKYDWSEKLNRHRISIMMNTGLVVSGSINITIQTAVSPV